VRSPDDRVENDAYLDRGESHRSLQPDVFDVLQPRRRPPAGRTTMPGFFCKDPTYGIRVQFELSQVIERASDARAPVFFLVFFVHDLLSPPCSTSCGRDVVCKNTIGYFWYASEFTI
jgi:hypothetical protein